MFGKNKEPKKIKKFKQDKVKLNECTCGQNQGMIFVPAGFTEKKERKYMAICQGCGELVTEHTSTTKSVKQFEKAWNDHMKQKQLLEPEGDKDEEYDTETD